MPLIVEKYIAQALTSVVEGSAPHGALARLHRQRSEFTFPRALWASRQAAGRVGIAYRQGCTSRRHMTPFSPSIHTFRQSVIHRQYPAFCPSKALTTCIHQRANRPAQTSVSAEKQVPKSGKTRDPCGRSTVYRHPWKNSGVFSFSASSTRRSARTLSFGQLPTDSSSALRSSSA